VCEVYAIGSREDYNDDGIRLEEHTASMEAAIYIYIYKELAM